MRLSGRTRIQVNINVDNIWNTKTARRTFATWNSDAPYLTDEELLAGSDYNTYVLELDPRYGKDYDFLLELRETGDYGGPLHVSQEDAAEAVVCAKRILDAVRVSHAEFS